MTMVTMVRRRLRRRYAPRNFQEIKCPVIRYPGSFISVYNLHKVVYFKEFIYVQHAIAWEKQIKGGSRKKKIELIQNTNNNWDDLYLSL